VTQQKKAEGAFLPTPAPKQRRPTQYDNINLLDSIYLTRDQTSLEKYKQIKNMDF
jgi:hypothetical protein